MATFDGIPLATLQEQLALSPEQLEDAKAELTALAELADQHFNSYVARDEEFTEAVLRSPVSIRKIRALVRRQNLQPRLGM